MTAVKQHKTTFRQVSEESRVCRQAKMEEMLNPQLSKPGN